MRRDHQTFRRLPGSGAVIYSTLTEIRRLTELDVHGKRKLIEDIKGSDAEVATCKGLELWQRAVIGYCDGNRTFRMTKLCSIRTLMVFGNFWKFTDLTYAGQVW